MTRSQRGLLITAAVLVAFLGGTAWQYIRAEALEDELVDARRELTFTQLEATLAAAAVQAHRGDFEAARRLSSDFFTALQANIDRAPAGAGEELASILQGRDATITSLSRAEPESRETVTDMFLRYRIAVGGPERALPVAAPSEPEDEVPPETETGTETGEPPTS